MLCAKQCWLENPLLSPTQEGLLNWSRLGKSGFLFEPAIFILLSGYLDRVIHDPKLRGSMGIEGKRIIGENLSTKVYVRNIEDMVSALRKL